MQRWFRLYAKWFSWISKMKPTKDFQNEFGLPRQSPGQVFGLRTCNMKSFTKRENLNVKLQQNICTIYCRQFGTASGIIGKFFEFSTLFLQILVLTAYISSGKNYRKILLSQRNLAKSIQLSLNIYIVYIYKSK